MKKGLLLVTGALVLGGLVACGPKEKPSDDSTDKKPTLDPEVAAIIDGFKDNTLNSTLKVTYTADYALEVKPDDAFQNYERVVKDNITIVADFTKGNPYLHIKRVGSEREGEQASTYEALVLKDESGFKYLTSYMADFASLANEETAFAKIADLIARVSTRNGGGLTTKSFVYDGMYTYEHREFVLGAKGYPVTQMNDDISYTITDEEGLDIATKMNYVGWQTDAGYSELNNLPKEAATVAMKVNPNGFVTKMEEKYNDAQLEMHIVEPPARLKLTGKRGFTAAYGETLTEAEKVTTIEHEAKPVSVKVKPFYNGGTVKVYVSKAEDLAHKAPYIPNVSKVYVGDWIIVEVKSTEGESDGIKSVSLDENSLTVKPVENSLYIFEATLEGQNQVNVVFENAKPAIATVKKAEGLDGRLTEYFTKATFEQFELVSMQPKNLTEMLEADETSFEVELSSDIDTWGAVSIAPTAFKNDKTWESFDVTVTAGGRPVNVMHFAPNPDPKAKMPNHYFAFSLKQPGEYTVDVNIKQGVTVIREVAYPGFAPTTYWMSANPSQQEIQTAPFMQTFAKPTLVPAGGSVFFKMSPAEAEKVTVKLNDVVGVEKTVKIQTGETSTMDIVLIEFKLTDYSNGDKAILTVENTMDKLDTTNAIVNYRVDSTKIPTFSVTSFTLNDKYQAENFAPVTTGGKVEAGSNVYIQVQFTLAEGVSTEIATINGEAIRPTLKDGTYSFNYNLPVAGVYNVTIVTQGPAQPQK